MASQTLTITYTNPGVGAPTDPYWIRIEQVLPEPDRATVSQTAALLDRAFGLEVCEDGGEGEDLVSLNEPALDEEQFRAATAEVIDLSYCEDGWDGSLDMHLKIIRSHPELDYTLRLIGCEQTGPAVPTSGTASLIATTADTLALEWPVVGDLQCEPAPVARVGNTLRFAQDDQSATLRASWATVYDLVPIRVPAAAFEDDRDLRALAFMHGMVADERISPDAPEEPDWSLCPTTDWQAPTGDQVTCYQIVRTHRLCSCSKYEMGVSEVEEVVPCPEGIHCSNNDTECMHLMGTVSQTEYVDCGPTDRTGTFDGDLSDPNLYLEKCCEWPSVGLPQCSRRTVAWRGGATIKNGEQHYRDLYGPATRFVPLSPPGGICGEWTIEQRIMGSNCCDGVDPLVWDTDTSPETMPPDSLAQVGVLGGGRYAYQWTVSGTGFSFEGGLRRITTAATQVRLYTSPDACGTARITVTDGCTVVQADVLCTVGQWTLRKQTMAGLDDCPFIGDCADYLGEINGIDVWESQQGRWRVRQLKSFSFELFTGYSTLEEALEACGSRYSTVADEHAEQCAGTPDSRCSGCFQGGVYVPCGVYDYSVWYSYDPARLAACDQLAYGWVHSEPGEAYHNTKAHTGSWAGSFIWEWTC